MSDSSPIHGRQGPPAPVDASGETTYRSFVDPDGVTWQVWEIKPTALDNGGAAGRVVHPDLAQGWLCFENARGDKRRLAPVPSDWNRYSFPRMIALWRSAVPVRRSSG